MCVCRGRGKSRALESDRRGLLKADTFPAHRRRSGVLGSTPSQGGDHLRLGHGNGKKLVTGHSEVSHFRSFQELVMLGTSLVVQWLRLCFHCSGRGFDPCSGN